MSSILLNGLPFLVRWFDHLLTQPRVTVFVTENLQFREVVSGSTSLDLYLKSVGLVSCLETKLRANN